MKTIFEHLRQRFLLCWVNTLSCDVATGYLAYVGRCSPLPRPQESSQFQHHCSQLTARTNIANYHPKSKRRYIWRHWKFLDCRVFWKDLLLHYVVGEDIRGATWGKSHSSLKKHTTPSQGIREETSVLTITFYDTSFDQLGQ